MPIIVNHKMYDDLSANSVLIYKQFVIVVVSPVIYILEQQTQLGLVTNI